ncbi:hypothetical protein SH501x_000517 [Pirellulaceae bacterium SH501]
MRLVPWVIVVDPGETSNIRTRDAGSMEAKGNRIRDSETTLLLGAAKL